MLLGALYGRAAERSWSSRRVLPERWRRWLLRVAITLPGVAILFYGTGDQAENIKVWHDCGLPFFLLAATLPVWRKPERGLPQALRWRELHRKVLWRSSAVLVFGATLGLIAYRWFTWHGDPGAAHAATETGVILLLLSPIPRLVDPLVWRAWPEPLRHAVRGAKASEELAKSLPWAPPEFDPDRGAGGRPKPLQERAGGRSQGGRVATSAGPRSVLTWDGGWLTFTAGRLRAPNKTYSVSVPGQAPRRRGWLGHRLGPAAELVWVSYPVLVNLHAGRPDRVIMILLDAQGYRILTITNVTCSWPAAAQVARSAGLSFAAYHLECRREPFGKICKLLFPRRVRSRWVRG